MAAQNSDYWGWLNVAKSQAIEFAAKAQEFATEAGKVAQEKAMELAKQAQNYDLESASALLTGSTINPQRTQNPNFENRKLTKADLYKLDMVYVTENLIAMGFPKDMTLPSSAIKDGDGVVSDGNDIDVVATYLRKRHNGRFMIWNISEESYDYSKFGDQVLEYKFPGHPAPPLGLLFKICTSVESWLDADNKNVAAVHCLTGKGRTATLMACILTWLGEFDSPMQALQYVAQRKNSTVDHLTIPSQRRYIQYFSNLLDGVKPNSEPLLLRRIIINSIPIFGSAPNEAKGCCPYIQLFKNGKLVASAAVDQEHQRQEDDNGIAALEASTAHNRQLQLKWITVDEGSASFTLDCLVQGDILLRCRHAALSGARVSMFRAAFHTGYVSGGVLRLTKAQCDGSASDHRFGEDFFIDLIFASASEQQQLGNASKLPFQEAAMSDKYEASLHKDARFWESISARKIKSKRRKARKFEENQQDPFSIDDPKFLIDQEDDKTSIEVDFTSSSGSNAFGNLVLPTQGKSYIDEDLIQQLAQLDESESAASSGVLVSPTPSNASGSSSSSSNSSSSNNNSNNSVNNSDSNSSHMGGSHMGGSHGVGDYVSVDSSDVGADVDPLLLLKSSPPAESASVVVDPADSTNSFNNSDSIITASTSAPVPESTTKKTGNGIVEDDFLALEELEKELGLSDFQLFGTSGNNAKTPVSSATKAVKTPSSQVSKSGNDIDELDELEKYLESLNSK